MTMNRYTIQYADGDGDLKWVQHYAKDLPTAVSDLLEEERELGNTIEWWKLRGVTVDDLARYM
jgi:hypothetical protein